MMRNPLIHLILATTLFVGMLAAYGLWFYAVSQKSAYAASLAKQIAVKNSEAKGIAQAKTELAALAENETTIRQYFVSTDSVVAFLANLQKTGSDLGSTVEVVSVAADPVKVGSRGTLSLSLKITGSFDAVLRTLGAIEYGPYDSVLSSLAFDTTPNAAGKGAVWNAAAQFKFGTQPPSEPHP